MSQFIDMLNPQRYAESNIAPILRGGSLTRDSLRKRLVHLNQLFLAVERGFRQCAAEHGFVETKVPSIVSTIGACENWQTLFKVDHDSSFFHLLAQTGQLFLEGALSHHERVSCATKSFRKEAWKISVIWSSSPCLRSKARFGSMNCWTTCDASFGLCV